MPTISDYIFNSGLNLGLSGVYMGMVNNLTATAYKSGLTGASGLLTVSAPPGTYTLYTSPTGSGLPPGGDWVVTGDTNYIVPIRNDANIFWDEVNNRLGIGTASPASSLHAKQPSGGTGLILDQAVLGDTSILFRLAAANQWIVYLAAGNDLRFLNAALGVDRLALTQSGHILSFGPSPTLGALQTGISSQSISGTDVRSQVSITTTASPPTAGAAVASVTFATAYASPPFVVGNGVGTSGSVVVFAPLFITASGFQWNATPTVGPGASQTYLLDAVVIG